MPVLDARFFVTAVLTQREAGGNLAEVLDNLSRVIRERFKVKRQVRVISAHGRITGCGARGPAAVPRAGDHCIIARTIWDADRRSARACSMIIGALVLQVVGTLIIRKIVQIEY